MAGGKCCLLCNLRPECGSGTNGMKIPLIPSRVSANAHGVCRCHSRSVPGGRAGSGFQPNFCDSYFGMRVLIAEDDRDSRELLSWLLEKLGYQVIAASNGKEAWDTYRRGRFRIVISDVLMPEIDGLELCRKIRKHKQSK